MIHSFLLIGQSNMAGRGELNEVEMICDKRIKMLRSGMWVAMTEPIHCDLPWSGVCPAASFAAAWLEKHPEEEIGLIPCAMGGTSLDQWAAGGQLFENAVSQAKLAMRVSKLEGFLWHQGETDCTSELIGPYYGKLKAIVDGFRGALGMENAPFLIGGLSPFLKDCQYLETGTIAEVMNEKLKDFAKNEHDCYYVTADGFTPKSDNLHISSRSQRVFGLRYFAACDERRSVWEPLPDEPDFIPAETPPEGQERIKKICWELFGLQL